MFRPRVSENEISMKIGQFSRLTFWAFSFVLFSTLKLCSQKGFIFQSHSLRIGLLRERGVGQQKKSETREGALAAFGAGHLIAA